MENSSVVPEIELPPEIVIAHVGLDEGNGRCRARGFRARQPEGSRRDVGNGDIFVAKSD